jgi:hypothetical protein
MSDVGPEVGCLDEWGLGAKLCESECKAKLTLYGQSDYSQSQSDIIQLFNSSIQTGPPIQGMTLLFKRSEEYLTTSRPE